ncbi:hypothetical protein M2480_001062 [Parabacteroides sp. PFB2-12]|uniref:hypothetical protein n=1 Tax=unclassified Parabacteroides TaxID=2649774 RepID=UPI002474D9B3|nr:MULTISPECIES: hypothetical protein [unclassified Parabacteroides]MDH6342440.1 hypothetical protein [Parabacteroides sp. PM6-13]MDH6390092.1 hypothetical protein [Parabacteroides sp. PFB2-12]
MITLLGFLFLFSGHLSGQNWNKISREIKKKHLSSLSSTYLLCHYNLRQKSKCFEQLHVETSDTIFILEDSNDYSEPTITLTLWNRSDTLTYTSGNCYYNAKNGGKIPIKQDKPGFTKHMMKLVSDWNIDEIRIEDEKNGGSLPQYWVVATRIILNEKKYKIDCLYFRYFFNIERDGMDFK